MDIQVATAAEALETCKRLARSGKATFFRGQTKDWPSIAPSLLRLRDSDRKQSISKLEKFIEWAKAVPQMAPYAQSREALVAIAQHYGLPTTFLDLTRSPEVAVLFSMPTENPLQPSFSVIYCFAEKDLAHLSGVRIVELSVENLWRLQVQSGLFLEFHDPHQVPDIRNAATRIHFPPNVISQAEGSYLYPTRKSALENVLDQWFYRHEIDTMMSDLSGIKQNLTAKRYSYPGAFRWRVVPDLPPQMGWGAAGMVPPYR